MIASMTGYGAIEQETDLGRVSVEVRSVNNRQLDVSIRLPREFNPIETQVRDEIKRSLQRGKVDMFIRWTPKAELMARVEIDAGALETYAAQIRAVQAKLGDSGPLPLEYLLGLPGVALGAGGPQLDPAALWASVRPVVGAALNRLGEERLREGRSLSADLRLHVQTILDAAGAVEPIKDLVVQRYREKLERKIEEWKAQSDMAIDEARLEAEVLFFAERSDITEELVRLRAHGEKFLAILDKPGGPVGKSLDFLAQEMLREVNTLNAKTRDLEAFPSVHAMKSAVEKIREQVQNIE
ncbi:MAG: YicC family protein [Candidatus Sumerlaeota bacterium]|nr:YicC family protein [Candidatus Sumerlaeota bacterium]